MSGDAFDQCNVGDEKDPSIGGLPVDEGGDTSAGRQLRFFVPS